MTSAWHAVVIGIDRYPALSAGKQLAGCVNDAEAIRLFLIDRVGVPESAITCLTSPREASSLDNIPATAANIRAAFAALAQPGALRPGDHVVLFYAGHGAALSRAAADGAKDRYYGLVAEDIAPQSSGGWANMILGSEIYGFLRAVEAHGATATVIADTCHSGASMRAIDEDVHTRPRALEIAPLQDDQWQALLRRHPALGSKDIMTPLGAYPGGDFVMLTGCLDSETSKEGSALVVNAAGEQVRVPHGLLTLSLLKELETVAPDRVHELRWMDFYDRLRETVAQRAMRLPTPTPQTPALEGRPEKPVFGGAWRPFEPGFTVRKGSDGTLIVDGGESQGLEAGARLLIYPPETSDFSNPPSPGVEALLESSTPMTSVARTAGAVEILDRSRARISHPSPAVTPIVVRVRSGGLPPLAGNPFFTLGGETTPAHAELRRWIGDVPKDVWADPESWAGARDGWVLVRRDRFGAPTVDSPDTITSDDIVAYLPDAGPKVDAIDAGRREAVFADALTRGLSAYSRYLRARDRRAGDETLASMLEVRLRAGEGTPPLRHADIEAVPALAPVGGVYAVVEPPHWIWAEFRVMKRTSLRLDIGWLAFSDDGNIVPLWPAPGARPTFAQGDVVHAGFNREEPLRLGRRGDQTASFWTLKAVACTSDASTPPLNIAALAGKSVQEEFAGAFGAAPGQMRGSVAAPMAAPERPAWHAWDLRVAVRRR